MKKRSYVRRRKNKITRRVRRKAPGSRVHNFTRIVQYADLTSSTTLPVETNHYFALDLLPNYTEFTSLFDSYRIAKIKCTFIPIASGEPGAAATALVAPTIVHALDYDDNSNISVAPYEYESCRITSMAKGFTRTLRPKPDMGAFSSTLVTASSQPNRAPWFDAGSSGVRHYGIRTYIPDISASIYKYRLLVKYWIQCKQVR